MRESLRRLATEAGLNSYEIPRDVLIESEPFSQENGLLSGVRKPLRPALTKRYGERLEALYTELSDRAADELLALRQAGTGQPVPATVLRAAQALLGQEDGNVDPGSRFLELGGDSLTALSFSQLLKEIFHVDIPVDVVINPVRTYNVVNPHEDGISLDTFVDWLRTAGHPLTRVQDYAEWLDRFETALRSLPQRQKQHSLLPLLHAFAEPEKPLPGSALPADRFRAAVRAAALDEENDIPRLSPDLITKYVADLRMQRLL